MFQVFPLVVFGWQLPIDLRELLVSGHVLGESGPHWSPWGAVGVSSRKTLGNMQSSVKATRLGKVVLQ